MEAQTKSAPTDLPIQPAAPRTSAVAGPASYAEQLRVARAEIARLKKQNAALVQALANLHQAALIP